MRACLVVGDTYSQLADGQNVVVASALRQRLAVDENWLHDCSFVLGQGMSDKDVDGLRELARSRRIEHRFVFSPQKTALELTHKRAEAHVLLSGPVPLGDKEYEFAMHVDERCDRLSDHVTGVHIGGMILIEAARQAVVAVLEIEHRADDGKPICLTWNSLQVRFMKFAFPVPTTLRVRVSTGAQASDVGRGRRGPHTLGIVIEQARGAVCEITIEMSIYDAETLSKIERLRVQRVVKDVLAPPQAEPAEGSKVA